MFEATDGKVRPAEKFREGQAAEVRSASAFMGQLYRGIGAAPGPHSHSIVAGGLCVTS